MRSPVLPSLCLAALSLIPLSGCGFDLDNAINYHGCELLVYEPLQWEEFELYLYHNEPRHCPVALQLPGEQLQVSGTVEDRNVRDFTYSELEVTDIDGKWLGSDWRYFGEDESGRYVVQHYVDYRAGAAGVGYLPDYATYEIGSGALLKPGANIEITYCSLGGEPAC